MNTPKSKKRVLIAGGAGFVGSNLARKLIREGCAVDCVDNLITGARENVRDLEALEAFRFIEADITNPDFVTRLARRRYDDVYNLACPTGVPNIAILGEEMLLSSSIGALHLLKIAQRSKARYLFASTAEAYGDPEVFPQAESYFGNVDPVGPRSPYEEGKRFGEALTAYFSRRHHVDARIVRIFNTYGPAMSPEDQRVIPQMLARMLEGRPITVFGDGQQTRTFLHVDDLLRGFEAVMDRGTAGEVYNIGGAREYTILDLFDLAKSVTGSRSGVVLTEHFIDDHRGRCPDTSKVRRLGWEPRISLEDGLSLVYAGLLRSQGKTFDRGDLTPETAVGRHAHIAA
jgi:UDP-glucuronate decarboxylase